jgi:hypothetical protein
MSIDKLCSYKDVCEYLAKRSRRKHLLLGNGFSMAYEHKIFSYYLIALHSYYQIF